MTNTPHWLNEPSLQRLFSLTRDAGGEARAVGGAVRDHLMDIEGGDVDVASTLTPERTIALAEKEGWKAIPTGIEHGTVTLVLPERVVEVTTLRRDVSTDGRRATVAFTKDWREDASRRDFTINALYMDASGTIHDYFDGQKDIASRALHFIGEPAKRIQEDGLRILRYFRFLATHSAPPADEAALAAIVAHKDMLDALSGERIANEMRKLLSAASPAFTLRLMQEKGIARYVFGRDIDPSRMVRLQLLESQADYQCSVWGRVVALLGFATHKDVEWINARWKLARHELKQLSALVALPAFDANAPRHVHTRVIRLDCAPGFLDWVLTQAAAKQGIDIAPFVQLTYDFSPPKFPVRAKDLIARGMEEGPALGRALAALEQRWEEGDYVLTAEELLNSLK